MVIETDLATASDRANIMARINDGDRALSLAYGYGKEEGRLEELRRRSLSLDGASNDN